MWGWGRCGARGAFRARLRSRARALSAAGGAEGAAGGDRRGLPNPLPIPGSCPQPYGAVPLARPGSPLCTHIFTLPARSPRGRSWRCLSAAVRPRVCETAAAAALPFPLTREEIEPSSHSQVQKSTEIQALNGDIGVLNHQIDTRSKERERLFEMMDITERPCDDTEDGNAGITATAWQDKREGRRERGRAVSIKGGLTCHGYCLGKAQNAWKSQCKQRLPWPGRSPGRVKCPLQTTPDHRDRIHPLCLIGDLRLGSRY